MKEEVIQITTGARSFALALGVAVVLSTNNFRPRIDDLAHLAHSRSRCSVLLRFNIFGIVELLTQTAEWNSCFQQGTRTYLLKGNFTMTFSEPFQFGRNGEVKVQRRLINCATDNLSIFGRSQAGPIL